MVAVYCDCKHYLFYTKEVLKARNFVRKTAKIPNNNQQKAQGSLI